MAKGKNPRQVKPTKLDDATSTDQLLCDCLPTDKNACLLVALGLQYRCEFNKP